MIYNHVLKKLFSLLSIFKKVLGVSLTCALFYLLYKKYQQIKKKSMSNLIYKTSKENKYIVNSMLPLNFVPSFMFPTYLTQACYHELKNIQRTYFKREYIINEEDSGLISLDWAVFYNRKLMTLNNYNKAIYSKSFKKWINTFNSKEKKSSDLEYFTNKKSYHYSNLLSNKECKNNLSLSYNTSSFYIEETEIHKERLLVIIHGLTGGSETVYIRDIVDAYVNDYSVVIIHARGINDTPLHTIQATHAGFTKDIEYTLNYIRKSYPSFKYVFLMGISMGANVSYQLLAKNRSFDDYILGYICISNPFHQLNVMQAHTKSLTDYFLYNGKLSYLLKNKDILFNHPNFDYERIINSKSTCEFDNEMLCKLYGYENPKDYYNKTSSGPLIDKLINIKTLILVSKDDPIVYLTKEDCKKSKINNNIDYYF